MVADFGERLKELREQKGWSQRDLAKRINKSPNVIWRFETNIQQPTLDILLSFAAIFGVSLDYLGCVREKEELNPQQENTITMLTAYYKELDTMDKKNRYIAYCELQKVLVKQFLE